MSRASMAGWLVCSMSAALVGLTGCRSLDSSAAVATKSANASIAATTAAATNLASGTTSRVAGATAGAKPEGLNGAPVIAADPSAGHIGPFAQLTEQQALSQVLPELQALALSDPATHNAVLEQMSRSEPSLWPLAIERAKSTAALRQKLAATPAAPSVAPTLTAAATAQTNAAPPSPVVVAASPEAPVARVAALPTDQPAVAKPSWPAPPPVRVAPANATQPAGSPEQLSPPPAVKPQRIENHHYFGDASPKDGRESEDGANGSTIRLVSATSDSAGTLGTGGPRPAAASWRESVDSAIASLEATLAGANGDRTSEHARLRLLRLVADQEGPAVAAIPGLPAAEQGYWSEQLYALATMLDTTRRPERPMRVAAAALHQQVAADRLGELGDLAVRNAAFCEKVYGFGAYEPIARPRFRSGEEATLYAEVDHYRSASTARGYHTSLATHYRVLDAAGKVVDEGDFPVVEDHCLSVRRDFHIQYGVAFPESLAPGAYRIELVINDQLGKKSGTDAVAFEIVPR
jgi:hypothetical protein